MAESPAHKFGQIIGDVIQAAIEPLLEKFGVDHGLYLDKHGPRPAREGRKVAWTDLRGNTHDLDFVLERGGAPATIGTPVAFIEAAWRRYTKHSRNKAQEIQGAIMPLAETYRNSAPFLGVILAGVFTDGAVAQLRSLGFTTLYIPYETIVAAFRRVGVDAHFDEHTPDAEFSRKVHLWGTLAPGQRASVSRSLLALNSNQVNRFMQALAESATRRISAVRVLPLHGAASEWNSITDAIRFIEKYEEASRRGPLVRYEVQIRYTNGDRIEGTFGSKGDAIRFLRGL